MPVIVKDVFGNVQSWAWLVERYGSLVIHPANPGAGWRLVEIQENKDIVEADNVTVTATAEILAAPTLICKALSADGRPAVDMRVAWYWPDAPENKAVMPVNGLAEGMTWGRAVDGLTNLNGDCGFAMGRGAYYAPPEIGPHGCWMAAQNSDVLFGLGMLKGTNHDHLDFTFRQTFDDVPPPEPEIPVEEILSRVQVIEAQCAEIRALVGGG